MRRLRTRIAPIVVLGPALMAAVVALVCSRGLDTSGRFAAYAPRQLPQRVLGDLDGDGLIDTAIIRDHAGIARLSVQLSG